MKHIFFLVLLLTSFGTIAQTGGRNYVLSRTFKQTGASANNVGQVQIQVNYLDGLGRPSQTVNVAQSPSGKDVVIPIEYDGFGREIRKYLPYTAANGNGTFQGSATTAQRAFYVTNNSAGLEGPNANLDSTYFKTTLEVAPSGRPLRERGPGLKSAEGTMSYGTNASNEVKWYSYSSGNVTSTQSYPAGRLMKKKTVDEEGKEVVEFTDLDGLLICKKVGTEALTTYYVYDDLNRLRAVLQPQFQEAGATFNEFAFQYDYDSRGRMILKKLPGISSIEMVYDNFDRLVLSRDGNQKNRNVWAFTKYDVFSRIIMTGEIPSNKTHAEWQTKYDVVTAHHETVVTTGDIGYTLNTTSVPVATGFPQIQESNVLNISYYDSYSFAKPAYLAYSSVYSPTKAENVKGHKTGGRTRMLTTQANWLVSAVYYDTEFRIIQTVRQLNGFATTDAYERVSSKYKYDIFPVVAEQKTEQFFTGSAGTSSPGMRTTGLDPDNLVTGGADVSYTAWKQFEYDHADRLLSIKEKLDLSPTKFKEAYTVVYRYNELGQLKEKWQHANAAKSDSLRRKTSYRYNIRGWVKDANTEYFAHYQDTGWSPFFRSQLFYQKNNDTTKYSNGNISKVEWKGLKETVYKKGLKFTYDGANRLTSASNAGEGLYTYTETETGISYDKNGNIKGLTRGGALGNIDQLTYTYGTTPSNKLSTISDASGNTAGVGTGLSQTYTYDFNGNMTRDMNRNAVLTYNYLNLPASVKIGTDPAFIYEYDASGVKHKYVADSTFKYAGGFEYDRNNRLRRLAVTDGQLLIDDGGVLKFNYYIKDHLGNVRVVYDQDGKTLQKMDYYPFGLEIDRNDDPQTPIVGNSLNRYLYNGKEKQSKTGYLDYGARMYSAEIGRWGVVDPLAEKMSTWSPYNYTFNNPIKFTDKDGTVPDIVIKGTNEFKASAFNNLQKLSNVQLAMLPSGNVVVAKDLSFSQQAASTVGVVESRPVSKAAIDKPVASKIITDLIKSEKVVDIVESTDGNRTKADKLIDAENGTGTGSTVKFDPSDLGEGISNADGTKGRPTQVGLGHELIHADFNSKGQNNGTIAPSKVDPDVKNFVLDVNEVQTRVIDSKIRQEQGVKERRQP